MSLKAELKEAHIRIKELEAQITDEFFEVDDPEYDLYHEYNWYGFYPKVPQIKELTLAGKVDALAKHLGVTFAVEQEETTTTGPTAKVVLKKKAVKKTAKKGKK